MKRSKVDLAEARAMADAMVKVLHTYEPQDATLAFCATLILAGRFLATQIQAGAPLDQAALEAYDVIADECIRVCQVER